MSDVRLRDDFVAMKIPATSANPGPGFDSMDLALDLWDEVSIHVTTGATSVVIESEGAGNVEQGEGNLIVHALCPALDRVGTPQASVHMHCTNRTPHSQGLGFSASAIVAGMTLARALIGDADMLGHQKILAIDSRMEGHPDNVAPAVFGGATVSWVNDETSEVGSVRLTPPEGINPVAFIPDFELRTAATRAVLLATVPHDDASFNVARGALLAVVLSGNAQVGGRAGLHALLMEAMRDRLHQGQCRVVMEPSLALVDWLRGAGSAAVISGAGPTVLSLESVSADIRRDATAAG